MSLTKLVQASAPRFETVDPFHRSSQGIDGLNQAATGMRSGMSRFKLSASRRYGGALRCRENVGRSGAQAH
jgi:hypothetical protein